MASTAPITSGTCPLTSVAILVIVVAVPGKSEDQNSHATT